MSIMLTVYITAQSIVAEFNSPGEWELALKRLRDAHVEQVVIEGYRALSVDEKELVRVRDRFYAEGFKTIGGMMPVYGRGYGKESVGNEGELGFFCYSSEETLSLLEAEARKLARVFPQVVIDDAFMTTCRCSECNTLRQGKDWGLFRRELVSKAAQRFRDAVHQERPDVVFTIKFPQTYDRYHRYGYDTNLMVDVADTVWVGTETRNPDTPKYGFTEPYQGYFNARWMTARAGEKFEGAWFDYLDCDDQLFYNQAVSSYVAAPRIVILFCYGKPLFDGTLVSRMASALPNLRRLGDVGRNPQGVYVLKPPNSEGDGDLFIFDYLGMLGIPCAPVTVLDATTMRSVIVPAQGIDDPATAPAIEQILANGGQVILTHAALFRLAEAAPNVAKLFGYDISSVTPARTPLRAVEVGGQRYEVVAPLHVQGDLNPDAETTVLASAVFGSWGPDFRTPFITQKTQPSDGKAVVWNLGTFTHAEYTVEERLCIPVRGEWLTQPRPIIEYLRNQALAPLDIRIEAPARVATFLFDDATVFVNYRSEAADVKSSLIANKLLWSDAGAVVNNDALTIPAGSYAVVPK